MEATESEMLCCPRPDENICTRVFVKVGGGRGSNSEGLMGSDICCEL